MHEGKRKIDLIRTMLLVLGLVSFSVPTQGALADECTPSCGGKSCGDNGCGGTCGLCQANFVCQAGECVFQGGCDVSASPGCGGCLCETCVCQQDPFCCSASWDAMCVARCSVACGGCGTMAACGDGTCQASETCDTCASDCGECVTECGQVGTVGCCMGQVRFFCDSGKLQLENCAGVAGQTCGWSLTQQQYRCGQQGFDPSLTWPRDCPPADSQDVKEEPLSEQCQDVPFPGCCSGKTLWWCDWNGLHEVDCGDNAPPYDSCGWNGAKGYYDCGGAGMDPSGTYGQFCPNIETDVQEDTTTVPKCKVGELVSTDCSDVSYRGCCSESGALFYCQDGKALCRLNCPSLAPPSNTCGWYIAGGSGYYDCGGVGADPAGLYGKLCTNLPVTEDLTTDVQVAVCPGVPSGGCCQGSSLTWCENGFSRTFNCSSLSQDPVFGQYIHCGTNPITGKADCMKTPDPSPPVCGGVVNPDPNPDMGPDTTSVDSDVQDLDVPDLGADTPDLAKPDLAPADGVDAGADSDQKDDNGFVIPVDEAPLDATPPGKKKDGGCSAGSAASNGVWLLVWGLSLLTLFARVTRRPRQKG